jgi:AcrR family transcriptional regulator
MPDAESRTRTYRSELRQRQAAETRRRVVEAAIEVFGENGYQASTFAQLAKRAGVSVETVQKHGPKSALLWAAVEVASMDVEGDRFDFLASERGARLLEVNDPDSFAALISETMHAVNRPTAGVWTAVTAAAHGDHDIRKRLTETLAHIRIQVENVLRIAAERGWLRPDVHFDDLVEALCVIISVETYVRFVHLDGKSPKAYKAFVARTIRDTVFASHTSVTPVRSITS